MQQPVQQPRFEGGVPGGKATGSARDYQRQCRDLLIRRVGELGPLEPLDGDGIDVEVKLGYAKHSFDVALKTPAGRIVVAECKRWGKKVSQGQVAEFADWVRRLGLETGAEVAAFFFAAKDPQLGLLQTAFDPNIRVVVLPPDQVPSGLVFSFVRYNPATGRPRKDAFAHITATVRPTATVSFVVIRADGRREEHPPR